MCAGVVAPAPRKRVQWKDVDAENKDNPLACSEYAQQIFEYLNSAEVSSRRLGCWSIQFSTAVAGKGAAGAARRQAAVQQVLHNAKQSVQQTLHFSELCTYAAQQHL